MATDRSDRVYESWRQSAERFDYFLAGLAGALAGYLGKSIAIVAFGLNAPTLELLAFVAFAASLACGLKRIERFSTMMKLSSKRLYHLEMAAEAQAQPRDRIAQDLIGGHLYTPEDLEARATGHRDVAARTGATEETLIHAAKAWYTWRDRLLVVGFVFLALARILPALVP